MRSLFLLYATHTAEESPNIIHKLAKSEKFLSILSEKGKAELKRYLDLCKKTDGEIWKAWKNFTDWYFELIKRPESSVHKELKIYMDGVSHEPLQGETAKKNLQMGSHTQPGIKFLLNLIQECNVKFMKTESSELDEKTAQFYSHLHTDEEQAVKTLNALREERNKWIAQNINRTLGSGEQALLIIGGQHKTIPQYLDRDISLVEKNLIEFNPTLERELEEYEKHSLTDWFKKISSCVKKSELEKLKKEIEKRELAIYD